MRTWIIIDGEKSGPFDIAQIARRLESGELKPDTYGWIEGMKVWQPLLSIPQFAESCRMATTPVPPPLPVVEIDSAAPPSTAHWHIPATTMHEKTAVLVRRFFARWFDMLLWSSGYLCVLQLSGADLKSLMMSFWFNYTMMIVWLLIEAAMIHAWGTTPGKALLGLRVRRADGTALPVGLSLLRSIRVYLMGMGMSHPLLLPLCHGFSWWFVRKHGAALWDGAVGVRVTMLPLQVWRWVLYAMVAYTILQVSGLILHPVSSELFREIFPQQAQWMDSALPQPK
jgi:uncharacterized RDD family membrane protein YckC